MKKLIKNEKGILFPSMDFIISIFLIVFLFIYITPILNFISDFVISSGIVPLQNIQILDTMRRWGWLVFVVAAIVILFANVHRKEKIEFER